MYVAALAKRAIVDQTARGYFFQPFNDLPRGTMNRRGLVCEVNRCVAAGLTVERLAVQENIIDYGSSVLFYIYIAMSSCPREKL